MSTEITVGETSVEASELDSEEAEKGRLAKFASKLRAVKDKIVSVQQFPLLAQMRGLGSFAWLIGFVGSILILNRFVSPIITSLAMTTLIAPIAALVLVVLGEFDFTKLTTMVTSNAGIVFATGGIVIAALFIQNVVKMALLTKSFTSQSHKQYRTYALASMFTPVTTSALWYLATKLGYFFGAKSIALGILAIFASGAVGEALGSIDPMNATLADLSVVANAMSNGLRWGLGFIVAIHLFFVFKSYGLVHKALNYLFDSIAVYFKEEKVKSGLDVLKSKLVEEKKDKNGDDVIEPTGWGCITILLIAASLIASVVYGVSWLMQDTPEEIAAQEAQEARERRLAAERQWRVACIDGSTYATEAGKAYRLTNRDGSSHCVDTHRIGNLTYGEPFSVGNSYRYEVVELDRGGYDTECLRTNRVSQGRVERNDNCRLDNVAGRNVRFWLELPAGLPEGVKMPQLPRPS